MTKLDAQFLDTFEQQFGPVARGLGRLIRPSIVAPKGRVFTWGDWSAIEARVVLFLSGSQGGDDVLQIFRDNDKDPSLPDIYKIEAGNIFTKSPEDVSKEERQVGKVATLALCFGGADGALTAMATGYGIHLNSDLREHIVSTWRERSKWARDFWGWYDNERHEGRGLWGAFNHCMRHPRRAIEVGECAYQFEPDYLGGTVFGAMPDGRLLTYPDVRVRELEYELENGDKERRKTLSYRRGYSYSGLWYGKLCLGADTLVGTDRGWQRIVDVRESDMLWDGQEWVVHDGLVWQGNKSCKQYDGVTMTPDHEVMTNEGWRQAQDTKRSNWAPVRLPDRLRSGRNSRPWTTNSLVRDVRLQHYCVGEKRRMDATEQTPDAEVVRVPNEGFDRECEYYARHVKAPGFRGVVFHAGTLSSLLARSMEKLRRTWVKSNATLAHVRNFLGRHGAFVPTGVDAGTEKQRPWVFEKELPLGDLRRTSGEPQRRAARGHYEGSPHDWGLSVGTLVPVAPRPVYDIVNAGPRSRFVVLSASGPVLVHNCENFTQGYAASKLRRLLVELDHKRYDWMPVVGHTHDEVITMPAEKNANEAEKVLTDLMTRNEEFDTRLPLAAEVTSNWYYTKAMG